MQPPDEAALAKSVLSFSDFLSKIDEGCYSEDLKVVVHHTNESIKIPEEKLLTKLVKDASLTGGIYNNIFCHTINFVREGNKNLQKLVIYATNAEIALKMRALGDWTMAGHPVKISGSEFKNNENSNLKPKNEAKRIHISGVNPGTFKSVIEYLHEFAEFSDTDKDITISKNRLSATIIVKKFLKVVPKRRVYSCKGGSVNHTVFIKSTGYDQDEIRSALVGKPAMSALFKKNSSTTTANANSDSWVSDEKRIIRPPKTNKVVICDYCSLPGHKKWGPNRTAVCPDFKEFLSKLKCFRCGEFGHTAKFCTKPPGENLCFGCHEPGHEAWEKDKCPNYQEGKSRRQIARNFRKSRWGVSKPEGQSSMNQSRSHSAFKTPHVSLSDSEDDDDDNGNSNRSSRSSSTSTSKSLSKSSIINLDDEDGDNNDDTQKLLGQEQEDLNLDEDPKGDDGSQNEPTASQKTDNEEQVQEASTASENVVAKNAEHIGQPLTTAAEPVTIAAVEQVEVEVAKETQPSDFSTPKGPVSKVADQTLPVGKSPAEEQLPVKQRIRQFSGNGNRTKTKGLKIPLKQLTHQHLINKNNSENESARKEKKDIEKEKKADKARADRQTRLSSLRQNSSRGEKPITSSKLK